MFVCTSLVVDVRLVAGCVLGCGLTPGGLLFESCTLDFNGRCPYVRSENQYGSMNPKPCGAYVACPALPWFHVLSANCSLAGARLLVLCAYTNGLRCRPWLPCLVDMSDCQKTHSPMPRYHVLSELNCFGRWSWLTVLCDRRTHSRMCVCVQAHGVASALQH